MAALAQPSQVYQACSGVATPMGALRFDNAEHRAWYVRFWTGDCAGTHSFCLPGSPDWMTTVTYVAQHAAPAQRAALINRTCRLGQVIGMEWARDSHIKRISLKDLRAFSDILRRTPDVNTALNDIAAKVAALLARPRLGG
ncbi:MAG TPA: hypothetical protein VGG29_02785 [Caulobacteraceae bacterium]|jgi:hypothetical protein